ncbi:hypothetical protein [Peribacillus butanolivorans]|uniref:hypothetical protein n=1 Tax=Peribacillus butanolivorans TaxID=421767 RepID=UPI0039FC3E5E
MMIAVTIAVTITIAVTVAVTVASITASHSTTEIVCDPVIVIAVTIMIIRTRHISHSLNYFCCTRYLIQERTGCYGIMTLLVKMYDSPKIMISQ